MQAICQGGVVVVVTAAALGRHDDAPQQLGQDELPPRRRQVQRQRQSQQVPWEITDPYPLADRS